MLRMKVSVRNLSEKVDVIIFLLKFSNSLCSFRHSRSFAINNVTDLIKICDLSLYFKKNLFENRGVRSWYVLWKCSMIWELLYLTEYRSQSSCYQLFPILRYNPFRILQCLYSEIYWINKCRWISMLTKG